MKKGIILHLACILLSCLLTLSALAGTTNYLYDDLHRLTRVERDDSSVTTYNYDELGNRTSVTTVLDTAVPTALFTVSRTSGTVPLEVAFFDQSTGPVTSWEWDFNNDGVTDSIEQAPIHTYDIPGTYAVRLEVHGANGSAYTVEPNYITVSPVTLEARLRIEPVSQNVSDNSGSLSFLVHNDDTGTMDWTAETNDSWLTIVAGNTGINSGNVIVAYESNDGAARSGSVSVTAPGAENSPQTFTVRQDSFIGPDVSVFSPVDGNVWILGASYTIAWSAVSQVGLTEIRVSYENGFTSELLLKTANDPGSVTWSIPGNSAFISTNGRIKIIATDVNGDSTEVYSSYFTVLDSEAPLSPWLLPEQITNVPDLGSQPYTSQDNSYSDLVVDHLGDVHMVYRYVEDDISGIVYGTGDRIYTQKILYKKNTGGVWSDPVELYSLTTNTDATGTGTRALTDSHIDVDSNGNPHVSWTYAGEQGSLSCSGYNDYEIYYIYFNGFSWEPPENVSVNSTKSFSANISVDSDDNVHFIWADGRSYSQADCSRTGTTALYHRIKFSDDTWSDILPLVGVDYYGSFPASVPGTAGQLHVIFTNYNMNIEYITWDGNQWSSPTEIATEGDSYYNLDLARGTDGRLHAVFAEWSNSEYADAINYITYNGSTWSVKERISYANDDFNKSPTISLNSLNVPQIVWYEDSPDHGRILYRQKVANGWSSIVQLSTQGNIPEGRPAVDISADDILHITWEANVDDTREVFYNFADISDDLTSPIAVLETPLAGETLSGGDIYFISWVSSDNNGIANISLEYIVDGGAPQPITSGGNTGSYPWLVPVIDASNVQIILTVSDFFGNETSVTGGMFTINFNPDKDSDDMDDIWEIDNGLDPTVDDSALDPDDDGLTNLEEFLELRNPQIMEANLLLHNKTISDTTKEYKATQTITAQDGFIAAPPSGDVTFEAGQKIILKPGFRANEGSKFKATIDPSLVQ